MPEDVDVGRGRWWRWSMVEEANEGGDDEASVVVERGLEVSVEVESR